MIDWTKIHALSARKKAYADARKLVTSNSYGFDDGEWNITEAINSTDERKYLIYQILDGVTGDCKRAPGLEPLSIKFRLKVLTRQACCRDKDGNRMHQSRQSLEYDGKDGDILPAHGDKPRVGDVVEWKAQPRLYDEENDREVTSQVLQEWSRRGIRPHTYADFVVDGDGCISVPYPFVLEMLTSKGRSIAFPKFSKQPKGKDADKRQMINWWFQEVPTEYKSAPLKASKKLSS